MLGLGNERIRFCCREGNDRISTNSNLVALMFRLETKKNIKLPTCDSSVQVYVLEKSSFRLVFVDCPGPLVSLSIVVPTVSNNNKGLPHTLEHLIFCGAKGAAPLPRGYLDNLAVRMTSTGTNAYTTDDHTCYELTTAGAEGMMKAFPVFMNHILNPTLEDAQFMTEVYHLDGEARHQGVVYCEMAARENTEADLLDLHLRKAVYENKTTYSFECGGLTKDIQALTNDEIKTYHQQFYHLDNLTAIICGRGQPQDFIAEFLKHDYLLTKSSVPKGLSPIDAHLPSFNANASGPKKTSETVYFPSDDEEVGSIGYSWPGPPSEDVYTIYALEILFRYLNDNPSSMIAQAFVERESPYASDVDLEIKSHVDSPIFFIFSGVPRLTSSTNGKADEEEDDESGDEMDQDSDDSEDEEDSEEDDEGELSHIQEDLFLENVYYEKLMECVKDFVRNGPQDIKAAIKRHRQKMQEALEDSPHELLAMSIIPDLIRNAFSTNSTLHDTRAVNGKPKIGLRLDCFAILDKLENEPVEYWKELAQKYLLDSPIHEILMIPSPELAKQLSADQIQEEKDRVKHIGKKGLAKIKVAVERAIEETKVNLSTSDLDSMPPIPDVTKAAKIKVLMENVRIEQDSQFKVCQVVKTETSFCHLGFVLNSSAVPEKLRPYFVLFQELLFQSPLSLVASDGSSVVMDYEEVAKYASELFASHECGVGFGNSVFSASYLSQLVTLFATAIPTEFERMIRFVAQVLLFTVFTKERIVSISKNLLSSVVDIKRDGNAVLSAVLERVSASKSFASRVSRNDHHISIFKQEQFLKNIVTQCKEGKEDVVIQALNALRNSILRDNFGEPSFLRIGIPYDFSLMRNGQASTCPDVAKTILSIWDSEFVKYSNQVGPAKKRKSKTQDAEVIPFPFPRVAFKYDQMEEKFGKSIIVPVSGISTSYLSQIIPCDLFKTPKHRDYFPTLLMAEILSKAEGPLYTGVRGQGFAYGVSLNCYLWAGQLSFELYRTSEPKKALQYFHQLLEELKSKEGFDRICTQFEIETAQAAIAYRWASNESTASILISTALRTSLQGYKSLEDYSLFIADLYKVTRDDLKRVFETYFLGFLAEERITIMTCPGSEEGVDALVVSFDSMVPFKVINLPEFAV